MTRKIVIVLLVALLLSGGALFAMDAAKTTTEEILFDLCEEAGLVVPQAGIDGGEGGSIH
jgi:hypothetical protein